jgi:hypothetical protein
VRYEGLRFPVYRHFPWPSQRQRCWLGQHNPRPGEEGTRDIQTGSLGHSPMVPNVIPFLGWCDRWCKPKH